MNDSLFCGLVGGGELNGADATMGFATQLVVTTGGWVETKRGRKLLPEQTAVTEAPATAVEAAPEQAGSRCYYVGAEVPDGACRRPTLRLRGVVVEPAPQAAATAAVEGATEPCPKCKVTGLFRFTAGERKGTAGKCFTCFGTGNATAERAETHRRWVQANRDRLNPPASRDVRADVKAALTE